MLVRKCPRSSRLFWNITRIMLIEAKFWYSVMMCGRRLERGQWPWVRPQAWNSRSAPPPWWPGLVAHLGAAGDISVQGLPKSWWAALLQKRGAIHKHFRMHHVRTYVCERIRRLENLLCTPFSFGCNTPVHLQFVSLTLYVVPKSFYYRSIVLMVWNYAIH